MGAPNIALPPYLSQNKGSEAQPKIDAVLSLLKGYLLGNGTLQEVFSAHVALFFELRIEALHWLVSNRKAIRFDELAEELDLKKTSAYSENKALQTLQENIGFTFRVHERLAKSLPTDATKVLEGKGEQETLQILPLGMSYAQFLTTSEIYMPETVYQNTVKLLEASLAVEAGLVCAMLLADETVQASDSTIMELCGWIADKAQTLGALSKKMGLGERKTRKNIEIQPSEIALQEDKMLAEQGMVEYANALQNA